MSVRPRTAMVLAAGLGTRMRPLTDHTAKPLLKLGARSLLDHALDRLTDAGVELAVVNTHWHASRVAASLDARAAAGLGPRTIRRHEDALLDTGGAVVAALPDLGAGPFYVVNGDAFWLNGPTAALDRLAAAHDATQADATLLLHRGFGVHGAVCAGDFALDPWGIPRRRKERELVPYVFAGVQVASPALYAAAPAGAFSNNLVWDAAIEAGRLRGVVHDGLWFHLSTPDDLDEAAHTLRVGGPHDI